jgi:AraC-like DNA-binding protein
MAKYREKQAHVGSAWRLLLRDLGLDARAILRRAGQPLSLFEGEGSFVSLDVLYALYDAIEQEADDPTLALQAGKVVAIELFDPALFAAICSPDLNTAAARLGEFKRLVGPFRLDVEVEPGETRLRYRCKHRPDLPWLRGLAEVVFLVALARRATRHPVVPLRATAQALPSDTRAYQEYLGCPVELGPAYGVVFAGRDAQRPFLTFNARMWDAFEPALRRRMSESDERRSTVEAVEASLCELLPSGRTQMRDVARSLGTGTRTLQRRLAAEDTTWLEVLNRTRERLARHYLESTNLSPAEVSFLLGFDDPNSLFRAFNRWTGSTPEAWRAGARVSR